MDNQDIVPVEQASPAIVTGIGNIEKGKEIATILYKIVEKQKLYALIQGKKYITVEGWNTLGAMLGCFPEVMRCVRLPREGELVYEAEVAVKDLKGNTVCRAIAICSDKEQRRHGADEYVIASMAQTRATGKAFRLAFSWIAHLAGYEATPAEEMAVETKLTESQRTAQEKMATVKQIDLIEKLMEQTGTDPDVLIQWLEKEHGMTLEKMSSTVASAVIKRLLEKKTQSSETQDYPVDPIEGQPNPS